jgi:hypothetical protein
MNNEQKTEVNKMKSLEDIFGDEQVVVWYGKLGDTKSCIEEKGFRVGCFDYSLLINQASVIRAAIEINAGLKYEGWEKYYVCRDMAVAQKLLDEVPTKQRWSNYKID